MSPATGISVVLPTRDRSALLPRALSSVFAQTRPPDEVIVVDDGSQDDTAERVHRDFPDARYLRQERRGVSAARNRGIREAKGVWLAFLDSDDEWLPGKLERQMEELARRPEERICHTNEIWIRRGRRVNPRRTHQKQGGRIFARCLPLCVISPSSVLVHRSVLDRVGLFDEELPVCEDYDLWLRITARYPVLYLDEPLVVKHGGHPDQLSRRYWGMDRFRIRAIENALSLELLEADRRAALAALVRKIDVYATGARKRGKWAEVAELERRREGYASLLES